MMELREIEKSYAVGLVTVDVLRGVGLESRPGDLLFIMGPPGRGKSTLMNVIGLLDRPAHGTRWLDGREIVRMDDDELWAGRNGSAPCSRHPTCCRA